MSTHLLTTLTDLVNYQSDFKLHKQQSLFLLKAMCLMSESDACQLLFHFCIKKQTPFLTDPFCNRCAYL